MKLKMNDIQLKKIEKGNFLISERLFSNMLKTAKKRENDGVNKKEVSPTRRKARVNKKHLKSLLKEFLDSEENFMKSARIIRAIFQQLRECYPNEQMIKQYDKHLRIALSCFEAFHAQFLLIWNAYHSNVFRQIEELAILYESGFYHGILADLSFLYVEFELWGAEFEYERRVVETVFFPIDIIDGVYSEYSPVIFIQRLPQIFMLIQESVKQSPHKNLCLVEQVVRRKLEEINKR